MESPSWIPLSAGSAAYETGISIDSSGTWAKLVSTPAISSSMPSFEKSSLRIGSVPSLTISYIA